MNTTIRNLLVALPLAAAAVTLTQGVAQADSHPSGPGTITAPTPGPIGPGDLANPTPGPTPPTGPGDLTAPQPCPTHGVVCGGGSGNGGGDDDGHGDGGNGSNGGGHHHGSQGGDQAISSIALPTRVDAGLAPAVHQDGGEGLELSWLIASGVLVTASAPGLPSRKRSRSRI